MAKPNTLLERLKLWKAGDDTAGPAPQHPVDTAGATITTIAQVRDREFVELRGVIRGLETKPRQGIPWLEADFTDGTGNIKLVWMGRRQIPGISAGRKLKVTGRLASAQNHHRVYNPRYELLED
ncbi:MAG: OB-fold nucleic acid binding domain-containing protein [Propionibacteriaceae bacterium]|jgi:RecG-like helicase|nr:OB-fold nucleic acid binding domain-containing protein [Propionibacteriaceae bacterium]